MKRPLLIGLLLVPLAAQACLNDTTVGDAEREYRSRYGAKPGEAPAVSTGQIAIAIAVVCAAGSLSLAGWAIWRDVRGKK